tara:strand:- start:722 stop:1393 length:672 start_codon:yes stop_codon:yes gene_type:complete
MRHYLILPITLLFFQNTLAQSIDYETEIQPIFNNSCMPCHQGNNPSAGLDLSAYETVMAGSNNGDVITIGDYQNSVLWQEVSSGDMPNNIANNNMGIADLTNEEVTLIENWILDLECQLILCEPGYQCVLGECICISDSDADEICDENDNCPDNWNPDQFDSDNDGIGDQCDPMPLSTEEITYTKHIIKTFNALGQETKVTSEKNTLIYLYDDGSVKKLKTIQ